MAWFSGKVSLGNFPDFAGAVNKLSESVKNIEKNFDSALGFEEKSDALVGEASGMWPSSTDKKALLDPVRAFMGNKSEESSDEALENPEPESSKPHSPSDEKSEVETDRSVVPAIEKTASNEEAHEEKIMPDVHPDPEEGTNIASAEGTKTNASESSEGEVDSQSVPIELSEPNVEHAERSDSSNRLQQKESLETVLSEDSGSMETKSSIHVDESESNITVPHELHNVLHQADLTDEQKMQEEENLEKFSPIQAEDAPTDSKTVSGVEPFGSNSPTSDETEGAEENSRSPLLVEQPSNEVSEVVPVTLSREGDATSRSVEVNQHGSDHETNIKERPSLRSNLSDSQDSIIELEKVKKEMKMMETALQGAARQAQAKADEIAKLMNENEQLKAMIEDARRKSNEAEIETLREEYHQRVSALERKVYALNKERDTLRREQNKKSDAAALLKEKDEIINQVMAEGEELSKKQAAQESQIRKLRAQIREFEEEKK